MQNKISDYEYAMYAICFTWFTFFINTPQTPELYLRIDAVLRTVRPLPIDWSKCIPGRRGFIHTIQWNAGSTRAHAPFYVTAVAILHIHKWVNTWPKDARARQRKCLTFIARLSTRRLAAHKLHSHFCGNNVVAVSQFKLRYSTFARVSHDSEKLNFNFAPSLNWKSEFLILSNLNWKLADLQICIFNKNIR